MNSEKNYKKKTKKSFQHYVQTRVNYYRYNVSCDKKKYVKKCTKIALRFT